MAEIDVQAIAEGIAVNLRTVTGDIQVIPFYDDSLPSDTNWTVGEIGLRTGENEVNIEKGPAVRTWMLHFQVTLYLSNADAETAEKLMLGWMGIGGARSVWNALESDRTAGGLLKKLLVRRSHSYANVQRDSQRLIKNTWDVDAEAAT